MLRAALALSLLLVALPARADEPEYKLEVKAAPLKVGQAAQVTLELSPSGSWHWNKEYPAKLELTVPEGLTVDRTLKQSAGDFTLADDKSGKVTAQLSVTAASQGNREATLKGKFGLCDDKVCIIKKVELTVPLVAAP